MIRIGAGAGYAGDRLEAAELLVRQGNLDYVVLECLAERTLALAHSRRKADPSAGYDALLAVRMQALLPACAARDGRPTRLVSNLGAANPAAALAATAEIASALGLHGWRIAAVEGDDVLADLEGLDRPIWETGEPLAELLGEIRWAHAYLGADALLPGLRADCQVVLGGRIADPSLFVAPLMHEFGWAANDWDRLGKGTVVGHLLECGAAVTGGYFADPGRKDVERLVDVGMPIAEVYSDGSATISKTPGSGGQVSRATVREQLLYEIHDPSSYLTPDVTADFSAAVLDEVADDCVAVSGISGHKRPDELKVILGVADGFIGEGEMSYAGSGCLARARAAAAIAEQRLTGPGRPCSSLRVEYIGYDSILGPITGRAEPPEPPEVRLRIAGRTNSKREAVQIGEEVEALTLTGPAGGCGKRSSWREISSVRSTSIPRDRIRIRMVSEQI